jgi:hypothetical protein
MEEAQRTLLIDDDEEDYLSIGERVASAAGPAMEVVWA